MARNLKYDTIKKNLIISQITGLNQYILENKIITIIGEEHRPFFTPCPNKTIKVSDYITNIIKKDNKSILLMEYSPALKIKNVEFQNSLNIMEIKKKLIENNLKPKVFGIDNRRFFLYYKLFEGNKVDMSTIIYGNSRGYNNIFWLPISSLLHKDGIIYSISTNKQSIFDINSNDYSLNNLKYLNNFKKEILDNISYFKNKLEPILKKEDQNISIGQYIHKEIAETYRVKNPERIPRYQTPINMLKTKIYIGREFISLISYLKELWASIIDFNILKTIYHKQTNNVIILIGNMHLTSLNNQIKKKISKDKILSFGKNINHCLNIKGSLYPVIKGGKHHNKK